MIFGKGKKIKELELLLENSERTLLERDLVAGALGSSHDGKRNSYEIYGYPKQLDFQLLYKYSRRDPIANRVVFGLPRSCWRDGFELKKEDKSDDTLLESEMSNIKLSLIPALERVDALNRIGKFSVLFVGVPDGLDTSEPVGRVMGNAIDSIYFRPFAYDGVTIFKYDQDVMSPRFGLPEQYQLNVIGRGDNNKEPVKQTIIAHHSRVVHVCETKYDSDVEGLPALEAVFNNILNIEKATGGSAEAYFRNARGKFALEVEPEFGSELIGNPEAKAKFDKAAKSFTNDQQDFIVSLGAKVTSHNTPTSSPLDTVKVSLWGISSQTKLPIRILTGEGSGQLAGSEDKLAYDVVVDDRQNAFCTPVLNGVLSILDNSGVIKLPTEYVIDWPKQEATTEAQQADIGLKKSQTINQLSQAMSNVGSDAIDIKRAFEACYLDDVEVDDVNIDVEQTTPPMEG